MGLKTEIAKILEKIDRPDGEEWDKTEYIPYKDLYLRRAQLVITKFREVIEGAGMIDFSIELDVMCFLENKAMAEGTDKPPILISLP